MAAEIKVILDTRRLDQIARNLDTNADSIVKAMAYEVQGDVVVSFGTGPAGRSYTHGSITHVASSPGYAPNVDTGALRASIHTQKLGNARWAIMDGVEYGAYLEFGTPFIAPRPFMYPAVFKMRKTFSKRFKGLFK